MFVPRTKHRLPRPRSREGYDEDGSSQTRGNSRLADAKNGQRRPLISWILQLLSILHLRILQDHLAVERADEERSGVPMDESRPRSLRHAQRKNDGSSGARTP